ncbi:hypothetical protein T12_5779 [Trichinella patagoniensis]|uniref:Uncharacterized protein n=1 Tax=Trichinella patagoniensis TaxID=990121 RepID=A0A0V0ZKV5_9BILA|nr:hypothetical protein T12_5779 [Trichinella patagoniensis]
MVKLKILNVKNSNSEEKHFNVDCSIMHTYGIAFLSVSLIPKVIEMLDHISYSIMRKAKLTAVSYTGAGARFSAVAIVFRGNLLPEALNFCLAKWLTSLLLLLYE